MNRRIYETVARKRACEGPLEAAEAAVERQIGSKGWHTRGYLPHYDKPGLMEMVTFRLADAMPASRRQEWEVLFQIKDEREKRTRLEAYLDRGCGECLLRNPRAAAAVEEVIQRFDGRRYRLAAWVVMPNHFHALVELWTITLGELLKAWKGVSAHAVNGVLGRSGPLWQEDYWDRYIRDEEHFGKARRYRVQSGQGGVGPGSSGVAVEQRESEMAVARRRPLPPRAFGACRRGTAPGMERGPERGHSCPPVEPGRCRRTGREKYCREWRRADKNVRAPGNARITL